MTDNSQLTRRDFMGRAAAATLAAAGMRDGLALAAPAAAPEKFAWPTWPVIVFTKVHHNDLKLSLEETADWVAEAGFDGIDCPVRPDGPVLPERVADDLPRMAGLMKQRNLRLHSLVTSIVDIKTPHTEEILRTAAKLGIRYYRLGFITVKGGKADARKIAEVRAQLKDLAALNAELGLTGMHQNHIGNYFGADTWPIYEAVKGYDPKAIGMEFDIGHATGAHEAGWKAVYEGVRSHVAMAQCKDYSLKTKDWVALGEGAVDKAFFSLLRQTGYANAIGMHYEYKVDGKNLEELRKNTKVAIKKDLALMRKWIKES